MEESRFMGICARVLQKQSETLSLDSDLQSIGWDSLANIEFVAELDDELGVQLDSESLVGSTTLGEIYSLVKTRLSEPSS